MRILRFLLAALFFGLQLGVPAHAIGVVPPDGDATGDIVATPSPSPDLFSDNDAGDRINAELNRFGGPLSESQKQAVISGWLKQKQTYAAQFAGASPPAGMPIWQSLGPTSAKYQTNGYTAEISDSEDRCRTSPATNSCPAPGPT